MIQGFYKLLKACWVTFQQAVAGLCAELEVIPPWLYSLLERRPGNMSLIQAPFSTVDQAYMQDAD